MRVLVVHNYYRLPGGEDAVVSAESSLLEANGHTVTLHTVRNEDIAGISRLRLAAGTVWSHNAYRELRLLIRQARPDVVHCHNTLPLISPAAYYAAKHENTAVVQTLHNYRLRCPAAKFFRAGSTCEKCGSQRFPWSAIVHGCYRGSRSASAAIAVMLASHRALGTYDRHVDLYIALTAFSKRKFVEYGFPSKKLAVKPNFAPRPPSLGLGEEGYPIYVGRLSEEKGIHTFLGALRAMGTNARAIVVGDGPLGSAVESATRNQPGVLWHRYKEPRELQQLVGQASCLVVPSDCYENFPMVVAESFAVGTPVVAARIGALAELVNDGHNGLHFSQGDSHDLLRCLQWVKEHRSAILRMRANARTEFENKYTPERNYELLVDIYAKAQAGLGAD